MNGRHSRWLWLAGVAVVLVGADSAWAWGPATHVHLASQMLSQAALLSAGLAALLLRHSRHFIYGNIAADVVLGKRLSKVKHSCHKWSTAKGLLKVAETPDQQAFAYGYLSHLAADVVAHNKYLPRQLLTSKVTMNLGHLFWEIRADSEVGPACWDRLQETLGGAFPQHERLMEQQLLDTLLSFEANLKIFNRMHLMTCARRWRRLMEHWGRVSRWELDGTLLRAYHGESLGVMRLAMENVDDPWLMRQDPAGAKALAQVRKDRRLLRRLSWQGIGSRWLAGNMAAAYAPSSVSQGQESSVA